jgi:hypothetical protein
MEMTMRKKILTMLVVPLIAALTAQAAAASEHHHTRAKDGAAAWEQLRNSNAYAAPGDIAVPSYLSNEANGAMAIGDRWSLICDVSKKSPGMAGALL